MTASSPQQLSERYNEAFASGRLDDIVAMYELDATLSPQPGVFVQGTSAIRERLAGLIDLDGTLETGDQSCIVCGDIALIHATWRFTGKSATGAPLDLGGRSAKVARLQADGTWKYVLDVPHGGAVPPNRSLERTREK
jgi:ketosteroid isomerase-like protein